MKVKQPPRTLGDFQVGDVVRKWDGNRVKILYKSFSRVRVRHLDGALTHKFVSENGKEIEFRSQKEVDLSPGTEVLEFLWHEEQPKKTEKYESKRKTPGGNRGPQ